MIHDICISLRQGGHLGLIARRFSRIVILIIEGGRRGEHVKLAEGFYNASDP